MSEPIIESHLLPTRIGIRGLLQARIVEAVEEVLREERTMMLGAGRYERTEVRRGSRNGEKRRVVTTERGRVELSVPRGRVLEPDGTTREFQSEILPRYARRTRRVDEAILGVYLAGANTRRVKKALSFIAATIAAPKGKRQHWAGGYNDRNFTRSSPSLFSMPIA